MIKTIEELKNVLVKFERNNIDYCIARNYEFILENKVYEGKDVDIVVLSKDTSKIDSLLKKEGFGRVPINPFSMHRGYAKYISEDKKLLQLHLHIDGVTGRHVRYLDAKDLLCRKIKKSFFYAPSREDLLLVLLLHNVLDLDSIREKYREEMKQIIREDSNFDKEYVFNKLSVLFTGKQSVLLLHLINKNDFAGIEKLMPALKTQFERKRKLKIFFVHAGGALWKLPFLFRKSPLVSLIGMDGTGKTTTTSILNEIFEKNRIKYSLIYTGRGRNNILPIQFFGKAYKKIENGAERKQASKNRVTVPIWKKIIYTLAAPVFALDLLIRYWFVIWPKRKSRQIVVTDRYSSDILLMANVPFAFKNFLYWFFPRPTLTIYLWNKPEVLHKRKPDHPVDDLIRQEKIFSKINMKIKPLAIKSERIEKTTEEVAEAIFNVIFR